ncbi:hypothetical protein [Pseudosporangium ferrugineum]|uniref:Uncharacterized protein n=1 Tax=Pseudosporangium ferrugineum TaxID=439699 RepID=A0A2T0SBV0_9ACTN|nr:hypothetical protein [Pseudosporangium ferrugineum]PRY30898.1 hypothetical protein CLV70_104451 [Pseudosporangium ferrugineum]
MTFGQFEPEYVPLAARLVAYYRAVVIAHTDDPVVGACLVCRVSGCEDLRYASARLAMVPGRSITSTVELAEEIDHKGGQP